ncbi:uncharacterized protein F5891DRAFT_1196025 [Suillus fuscotomentosus]|uniref:Uncharacterized protein n=1 Tax=Suillus fuscotomentosus TaxID=1912939 RepID=A0AAD4DTV7_9AGAM|nr:uncharacterized protein F5891DRAFT_1196025 [Suillus fuscotomentosus]KAG1844014.1 hypothetical protein C8R48DRAFT_780473 [Suillus tomentosus]KAG1893694.1 hypothetical protein F5891DRAFT_1196025 [Suillus fuscotomentosus]
MLVQVAARRSQSDVLRDDHCVEIQSMLLSVASDLSPFENALLSLSSNTFYIFDKWGSDPFSYVALEQYMPSLCAAAVRKGVSDTVHAYAKTVATAAKEKYFSCSRAEAELIKAVLGILSNHYLDGVPKWS